MGQLYIPGKKEIKGPWLIDSSDLEDLHQIFEFIESKIVESTNLEIQELAKTEVEKGEYKDLDTALKRLSTYRFSPDHKTKRVVLISNDEKRLIDSTVMGILKDPKLKDFKPANLDLNIEFRHSNRFNLSIERRFDGELKYNVNCFDQNCEDEIRYKVEKWIENCQPSKPRQFWSEFSFFFILLSFLGLLLSGVNIVDKDLPDFQSIYTDEIARIIKSGVNKENETKAIELLLKYTTNYREEGIKEVTTYNPTAVKAFYFFNFFLLISIFRPRTIIGIGRHHALLKFYKFYTTAVLISLPSIFILAPLLEWIKGQIGF